MCHGNLGEVLKWNQSPTEARISEGCGGREAGRTLEKLGVERVVGGDIVGSWRREGTESELL